jgi:hypothetical protein
MGATHHMNASNDLAIAPTLLPRVFVPGVLSWNVSVQQLPSFDVSGIEEEPLQQS